jgi:hypothetical protein
MKNAALHRNPGQTPCWESKASPSATEVLAFNIKGLMEGTGARWGETEVCYSISQTLKFRASTTKVNVFPTTTFLSILARTRKP